MTTEIKIPELGENIETAEVLSVLVKLGDRVEKDQPIIELETDKATAEVPAESAGVVLEILVKAGQTVKVGAPILRLEDSQPGATEEATPHLEATNGGVRSSPAATEVKDLPAAKPTAKTPPRPAVKPAPKPSVKSASRPEATSGAKSAAKPAAKKSEPSPLRLVERAEPTPVSGARETLEPEEVVAEAADPDPAALPPEIGEPVPAAPSVRRLARELGIDINQVEGSSSHGRVSEEDVKTFARRLIAGAGARPAPLGVVEPTGVPPLPDFSPWGEVEREPASKIRRVTAEAMSLSWSVIPHVTQFDRADITELETWRKHYASRAEAAGGKLTLTAIAVKVLAAALKVYPKFNASYDAQTEEIVYKRYVNVGVAVDTEHGLLVPVIHDADTKNIVTIAAQLGDLAERSRSRKIAVDELQGANINLSNLGGLGTTYFSPIVAWPHVAVVGLGRASLEAVHHDGVFEPRLVLPLSLSYDHRVIDGAEAARFLRWMAEAFEEPMLLALEG